MSSESRGKDSLNASEKKKDGKKNRFDGAKDSGSGKITGKASSRPAKTVTRSRLFKLCIRRLPARDYSLQTLQSAVDAVNAKLTPLLDKSSTETKMDSTNDEATSPPIEIEHFIPGKISRKRGPLTAAAFLSTKNPSALIKFLQLFPNHPQFPFIDDDQSIQPEIMLASYSKCLRTKEISDRYEGSYESDPEYKKFLEYDENRREAKLPSVEQQLETIRSSTNNEPETKTSENAIIKYLRLRSQKKFDSKAALLDSEKGRGKSRRSNRSGKESGSSSVVVTRLLKKSVLSSSNVSIKEKSTGKDEKANGNDSVDSTATASKNPNAQPSEVPTKVVDRQQASSASDRESKQSTKPRSRPSSSKSKAVPATIEAPLSNSLTTKPIRRAESTSVDGTRIPLSAPTSSKTSSQNQTDSPDSNRESASKSVGGRGKDREKGRDKHRDKDGEDRKQNESGSKTAIKIIKRDKKAGEVSEK